MIAIDLPGHGCSDMMDSSTEYLHKRAAKYVIAFCEVLNLERIQVIGFSSGALIALNLATLKPALTEKIIVVAGQLYYSDFTRKFILPLAPIS